MDRHRRLTIFKGGEILARATGIVVLRGITFSTRPPTFRGPATVGSHQAAAFRCLAVTHQNIRLNRRANSDDFIRVMEVSGGRPKNSPTRSRTSGSE